MIYTIDKLPNDCLQVIEKINGLRTRLRYATSDNRRRWTGMLRRSTFALAIQGSNSIEGYNVTYEDAIAAVDGEEPMDAKQIDWLNIKGYQSALSYILQLADDPYFEHNEGTIRSLHYMMIGHDISKHPGLWRPGAIWVKHEPTGQTVYEGPPVELVPGLIRELIKSLVARNDLPVMVRAALAHLNLVMIHPFSDGNGRMGRALQTMVLARERILDPRFSSIEEYLGKHTPKYYDILAEVGQGSWHPERDTLPFLKFCLTAHYHQAESLLRRNNELELIWNALDAMVKTLKLNDRMIYALADATYGFRVRNSGYRKLADISNESASKDLRFLVERGLLVPKGERRGRYYIASDTIRNIRKKLSRPEIEPDPFADLKSGPISTNQPELSDLFPDESAGN